MKLMQELWNIKPKQSIEALKMKVSKLARICTICNLMLKVTWAHVHLLSQCYLQIPVIYLLEQ